MTFFLFCICDIVRIVFTKYTFFIGRIEKDPSSTMIFFVSSFMGQGFFPSCWDRVSTCLEPSLLNTFCHFRRDLKNRSVNSLMVAHSSLCCVRTFKRLWRCSRRNCSFFWFRMSLCESSFFSQLSPNLPPDRSTLLLFSCRHSWFFSTRVVTIGTFIGCIAEKKRACFHFRMSILLAIYLSSSTIDL